MRIQLDRKHGRFLPSKFFGIVFLALLLIIPYKGALALSGCSATVSPTTAEAGSSATATFIIRNDDALAATNWIHISRPSDSFWIAGISSTTWSVAGDSTQLYLTNDTLPPGQSLSVDISFSSNVQNLPAQDWIIEASDSGDAGAASTCGGQHSTSVSGNPSNSTDNGVSDVLAVSNTSASTTVSWHSDYVTSSYIYYGTTSGYGHVSTYDSTQSQDHSLILSGLQPDSSYHFQVAGSDSNGSSVWSADNTFISGGDTGGSGGSSGGGNNQNSGQGGGGQPSSTPLKSINITPPPVITINTVFTGVYKAAPRISGTAKGTVALRKIEYSTDNAKNWLPADTVKGLGTLQATYSFSAANLKDGNYFVVVRATDDSSNTASFTSKTFVIDLLPPIVGATVMKMGAQSVLPDQHGVYNLVEDTDATITLNAVGGPTAIYLQAQLAGSKKAAYTFNMKKSLDTGLWAGIASFTQPGVYVLQAHAADGALNKTTRSMGSVNVQASGAVTDAANKPVAASITVYFLDPETNKMTLWDAGSSDQTNPLATNKSGTYALYLPAGTYYLKITAPGYKTVTSSIFHSRQPLNIASAVKMSKKPRLHVGKLSVTLPWVSFKQTKLNITSVKADATQLPVNQKLPAFSLGLTSGKKLSTADLYAKPTVLSFMTTWSDAGRDQLSLLSTASSEEINIVPVVSGETAARLKSYVAVAGYSIPVLVDSTNQLAQDMGVSAVPTHYFIDRRGSVIKTITGVLSPAELMANATN